MTTTYHCVARQQRQLASSLGSARRHKDSRHRVGRRVERLRAVALGRRHACLLGRPVRMASAGPTLTSVQLLRNRGADAEPVLLGSAHDVSSFGYFERKAVREMLAFVGRTVAKRTPEGQRQSVAHEAYICHAYNRGGLVGLCFVGKDYPSRAAFSVVNRALDDYCQAHGEGWRAATQDGAQGDEAAQAVLTKFQDPHEADKLLKIQRELDETKVILHKTIDSVLQRGEKLDSLVDKSNDLSTASTLFYKAARKNNQCCKMM